MELLRRVSWSAVGGGGLGVCAEGWARSIRSTVAPKSARRRPAKGPGHRETEVCVEGGGGDHTWRESCELQHTYTMKRR